MIGILCAGSEAATAEEFFQLFKTPWEPYVAGRSYDVVIATTTSMPEVDARLTLIFQSDACTSDAARGFRPGARRRAAILQAGNLRLPVYGEVLTFEETAEAKACVLVESHVVGISNDVCENKRIMRFGYDLFKEVEHLLSDGQPAEHALVPTLDLHIDLMRQWILQAGLSLIEIPPSPAGNDFIVCLTHDIDFIGIRNHRFDHTMWGFLLRATVGAVHRFLRGRIGFARLTRCWRAAASLPFIYLGWLEDFWLPFPWYLKVEKGLASTYYLMPYKNRIGEKVRSKHPKRRAAAYDVSDISDWVRRLQEAGCEIGVHGIDAWHSAKLGKEERLRVSSFAEKSNLGIRMHWLLWDAETVRVIEEAGYDYDGTFGYNETAGYRAGTAQVYRPAGARRLLELPLHVQDGSLFFAQRLNLREDEAWNLCGAFVQLAQEHGGVLTVVWHDRSHGPERFWGEFYVRVVEELKRLNTCFWTAGQAVEWFRARRSVAFERCSGSTGTDRLVARSSGAMPKRNFALRFHFRPRGASVMQSSSTWIDVPWSGASQADLSALVHCVPAEKQPIDLSAQAATA
jgi:hypothetical protein